MDEPGPRANILIVDDEPSLTRPLARMLELMGYASHVAASGEAALDEMERKQFDLVLLDPKMPDMDGLEVLAAGQTLAPGTTFVILTAKGSLDSAIIALRHGAVDYLLKPCSVDDIVKTIKRGLARQQCTRHPERLVGLLKDTLTDADTSKTLNSDPPDSPLP
jgi:DNA-binding NtrC family response regulator